MKPKKKNQENSPSTGQSAARQMFRKLLCREDTNQFLYANGVESINLND